MTENATLLLAAVKMVSLQNGGDSTEIGSMKNAIIDHYRWLGHLSALNPRATKTEIIRILTEHVI